MVGHQKKRDEVATLKATVKQKECEIAELSSYMECLKAELDLLKPKADKYAHDSECYRQQYVSRRACTCSLSLARPADGEGGVRSLPKPVAQKFINVFGNF